MKTAGAAYYGGSVSESGPLTVLYRGQSFRLPTNTPRYISPRPTLGDAVEWWGADSPEGPYRKLEPDPPPAWLTNFMVTITRVN